jgi:methylphosphotriester-DNA--protein-cysteine methyltransferase
MSTHIRVPPFPLSECIDILWLSEGYAPRHAQERLMPSGLMNLIVTWDASGRIWSGVSGVQTKSMLLDTSVTLNVFGVSFKPGGGFPFLPMPAGELHNLQVPLDAVWTATQARVLSDQLAYECAAAHKFRVIERALLAVVRDRFTLDPAVRYAVSALGDISRPRSVSSIVERVGMSQRRFIELFSNEVGVTPKAYARVRRFQHVLRSVEDATGVDWADVAVSCGYFDQAHFVHDFREFAGVTPSMYLRFRASRNHVAVHD